MRESFSNQDSDSELSERSESFEEEEEDEEQYKDVKALKEAVIKGDLKSITNQLENLPTNYSINNDDRIQEYKEDDKKEIKLIAYTLWQNAAMNALEQKYVPDKIAEYQKLGEEMRNRWKIVKIVNDNKHLQTEVDVEHDMENIISDQKILQSDLQDIQINPNLRSAYQIGVNNEDGDVEKNFSIIKDTIKRDLEEKPNASGFQLTVDPFQIAYAEKYKDKFLLKSKKEIQQEIQAIEQNDVKQNDDKVNKAYNEQREKFYQELDKLLLLSGKIIDSTTINNNPNDEFNEAFKEWKENLVAFKPIENKEDLKLDQQIEQSEDSTEFAQACKEYKQKYQYNLYRDKVFPAKMDRDINFEQHKLDLAIERQIIDFPLKKDLQERFTSMVDEAKPYDVYKNFISDNLKKGAQINDLLRIAKDQKEYNEQEEVLPLLGNNLNNIAASIYINELNKILDPKPREEVSVDANEDNESNVKEENLSKHKENKIRNLLSNISNKELLESIEKEINDDPNFSKYKQDIIDIIGQELGEIDNITKNLQFLDDQNVLNDQNKIEESIRFLTKQNPDKVLGVIDKFDIKDAVKYRSIYDPIRDRGIFKLSTQDENIKTIQSVIASKIVDEFMNLKILDDKENSRWNKTKELFQTIDTRRDKNKQRRDNIENEIASFYENQYKLGNSPSMVNSTLIKALSSDNIKVDRESFSKMYRIFQKYSTPEVQIRKISDDRLIVEQAIQNIENKSFNKDSWSFKDQNEKLQSKWFGKRWLERTKKLVNRGDLVQPKNTITGLYKSEEKRAFFKQLDNVDVEDQRKYITQFVEREKNEELASDNIEEKWKKYDALKEKEYHPAYNKAKNLIADSIQNQLGISDKMLIGYNKENQIRIKDRVEKIASNAIEKGGLENALMKCETEEDLTKFFANDEIKAKLNEALGKEVDDLQLAVACKVDDIDGLKQSFDDPDRIEYLRSGVKNKLSPENLADTLIAQSKCEEKGESNKIITKLKANEDKKLNEEREKNAEKRVKDKKDKEKNKQFNKKIFLLMLVFGCNPIVAVLFAYPPAAKFLGHAARALAATISFVPTLVFGLTAAACAKKGERMAALRERFIDPMSKILDFSEASEKKRDAIVTQEDRIREYVKKNPPVKLSSKIKCIDSILRGEDGKLKVNIDETKFLTSPKEHDVAKNTEQHLKENEILKKRDKSHNADIMQLLNDEKIKAKLSSIKDNNGKQSIDLPQQTYQDRVGNHSNQGKDARNR